MQATVLMLTVTGVLLVEGTPAAGAETPPQIDYVKQIKPLLVKHCGECHSATKRESGFRIDRAGYVVRGGDRGAAVVPGKSAASLLVQVLKGEGDVSAMPFEKPPLGAKDIALVSAWIDQGGGFPDSEQAENAQAGADHWAFQPIAHPSLPDVKRSSWIRNGIDTFVLARLERDGLAPSPQADRTTLIRRLSLDLLGVPPSVAEVDRFLRDEQPGAYERLVERILASPRYGEHWGRHWLDVARYADSDGFTIDGPRPIWKYREWVIRALNRDLPFDQFTLEQMAGDLLPNPTLDQLVATGFHRNTLVNQEGGTDDEQFRVESVVDRVNTVGAAYLGLTIGCAQCHEHKYDPLTQRDFYRMYAIFNNTADNNDADNSAPKIPVPTLQQSSRKQQLNNEITEAEKPLAEHDKQFAAGRPAWEKSIAQTPEVEWTALDPHEWSTAKGAQLNKLQDNSLVVDFSVPANDTYTVQLKAPLDKITAVRIDALTHPSLPETGPGRGAKGNFVLSEVSIHGSASNGADQPQKLSVAKAIADHAQEGYAVSDAIDGNPKTGWSIGVKSGSLNVDRQAIFILNEPLANAGGSQIVVEMQHNHSVENYLVGRFRVLVTSAPVEQLAVPQTIRAIAKIAANERKPEQEAQLNEFYKSTDNSRAPLAARVSALKKQLEQLNRDIPLTMVLKEMKAPRETFIQIRGDFLRKGARVTGGVPEILPQFPTEMEPSRADFARWLFNEDNPLTARVTVNRFWQRFFGLGLVETENDFGLQGTPPSHPQLLDWLASEFRRNGWSLKAFHRLIVTSNTYRQSSAMSESQWQADPRNRLLARQTRSRLTAESVRDVGLFASGLLSDKLGGPSVYPPQPKGIYILTQQKKAWPESQGEDRYRRTMYTYFWRSSPHPFLMTFDAPDAYTACTRRSLSNTPLQALTLANDRGSFEIAQGFAASVFLSDDEPSDDVGKLRLAFRRCVSREPNSRELDVLTAYLIKQRQHFEKAPESAAEVAPTGWKSQPAAPRAAAWTAVARVLLNLDEFITRE